MHRNPPSPYSRVGSNAMGDRIADAIPDSQGEIPPVAPNEGGVGGSTLRDLGLQERRARREERRAGYQEYLDSALWRSIRDRILTRDDHRCRTLACQARATVVHHIRYPKVLGQEKDEWLYSLCAPCHDGIHRLTPKKMTLRAATLFIIEGTPPPPKKRRRRPKGKSKPHVGLIHKTKADTKRERLAQENDELHARFARNRERRAQRKSWGGG